MASAALASLTQLVNQILSNLQSYSFSVTEKKMASLHDNFVFLQNFLQRNSGQTIGEWDVRIRDVVYQATNIIKSHVSKKDAAREEEQFDALQCCIDEVDSTVAKAMKMKEIPEKEDRLPASSAKTSSHASVGKEPMVGVDEDLTQIKDRVTGDEKNLQIIQIIGMGGIDKTTLAKRVY